MASTILPVAQETQHRETKMQHAVNALETITTTINETQPETKVKYETTLIDGARGIDSVSVILQPKCGQTQLAIINLVASLNVTDMYALCGSEYAVAVARYLNIPTACICDTKDIVATKIFIAKIVSDYTLRARANRQVIKEEEKQGKERTKCVVMICEVASDSRIMMSREMKYLIAHAFRIGLTIVLELQYMMQLPVQSRSNINCVYIDTRLLKSHVDYVATRFVEPSCKDEFLYVTQDLKYESATCLVATDAKTV